MQRSPSADIVSNSKPTRRPPDPDRPLSDVLRQFADRQRLDERVAPYAAQRWATESTPHPTLHLEDVSAIPFLRDIAGVEEYQHRARVRAEPGDLYATVTPPDPDYEAYCEQQLGLGPVRWLEVRAADDPLAVTRGCQEPAVFRQLVEVARAAGGLCLHPYMSIDDTWALADRLAADAGVPSFVIGPPPPVTWIANDKAHFVELVRLVLGPGWVPETQEANTPDEIATLLTELASRHARVGLKRTRCASGTGNLVLEAGQVCGQSPAETAAAVDQFLTRTEWPGDEPVLVVAWESAAASPSTQWWIPDAAQGEPRLDGIYEQILEGEWRVFVGSRPSTLADPVNESVIGSARAVAQALQTLGYVGRCSFDHLVLGDPDGEFTVLFTECNGRWGGTSTPMHLVDRVVAGPRPPYRAQDFVHEKLTSLRFGDVLERLGPEVFDRRTQRGRFLFYNVGPLAEFGKLDVIALGATQAEAEQAMLADLPRLLGL